MVRVGHGNAQTGRLILLSCWAHILPWCLVSMYGWPVSRHVVDKTHVESPPDSYKIAARLIIRKL